MYLHVPEAFKDPDKLEGKPWHTRRNADDGAKRQCAVRPVKSGNTFWFHADFDNLSRKELELLCFALRPSEDFRHKLGMGKSIGLGSVEIEPVAICLIDRGKRYAELPNLFSQQRYSKVGFDAGRAQNELPEEYYPTERREISGSVTRSETTAQFAQSYREKIDGTDVWKALELLGEPKHVQRMAAQDIPVCPPYIAEKACWEEQKTYEWFARNAAQINCQDAQWLRPLNEGDELPTLQPIRKRQRRSS
jgi:hypothetical protein